MLDTRSKEEYDSTSEYEQSNSLQEGEEGDSVAEDHEREEEHLTDDNISLVHNEEEEKQDHSKSKQEAEQLNENILAHFNSRSLVIDEKQYVSDSLNEQQERSETSGLFEAHLEAQDNQNKNANEHHQHLSKKSSMIAKIQGLK